MALDLDDNLKFHRANWIAQRIGWILILLIVLAALGGLTGHGPLGDVTAGDNRFRVQYGRIMRQSSPSTVTVTLRPPARQDSTVRFWVNQDVMNGCQPRLIMPTPRRILTGHDRTEIELATIPDADSAIVRLICEPDEPGSYMGALGLVNGPTVHIRAIVLP